MDIEVLSLLGRILRYVGWVFLPFLLLPMLTLIWPKSTTLAGFQSAVISIIDAFNMWVGEAVKWLLVSMVLGVAFATIALSIFGQSWPKLDESVIYMHASVIFLGSAATLLAGQHVRVDIFHSRMKPTAKALVDILGFFALLVPFCLVLLWNSQSFISLAWVSLEGSTESSGIQGVYILKTFMGVFAVTMLVQGLSIACRAAMCLAGQDAPPLPRHIDPMLDEHEHLEAGL